MLFYIVDMFTSFIVNGTFILCIGSAGRMITTQTGKQSVIWVSVSLLCLGFTVCVYISMFGYVPQYG